MIDETWIRVEDRLPDHFDGVRLIIHDPEEKPLPRPLHSLGARVMYFDDPKIAARNRLDGWWIIGEDRRNVVTHWKELEDIQEEWRAARGMD